MARKMSSEEAREMAERIKSINTSKVVYEALFSKLNVMVNNLKLKYPALENRESSSSDSDEDDCNSDECENREAPAASLGYISTEAASKWEELKKYMSNSNDNMADKNNIGDVVKEYPQRVEVMGKPPVFKIGSNGTQVTARDFEKIEWHHSAAFATRTLLSLIFSAEVLATHSLSGKPSAAFHGRERPAKMQLDKLIVADITHCVMAKCCGREREIRSAITTTCAEAAKKNRRRLQRKPPPTEM